jgi:ABC-type uncharacterized transport system substrate-binding protein
VTAASFAALALVLLAAPARAAAPRRVALVAQEDEPLRAAVVRRLSQGRGVSVLTFVHADLADPIKRGELLARLSAADLVVPVGDAATELVLEELEDTPVYFVGAAVVPGRRLGQREVSGMLAYDPARLLDAAAALWRGKLGLAYTPGYEPVAAAIRDGARARGLEVEEKRIDAAKGIPAALGGLLSRCKAVWLLGDPLLARGAGFEFAAERSLSLRVPLISVDGWQVRRGALLGSEPEAEPLAAAAAGEVAALRTGGRAAGPRVRTAPAASVLVNAALSRGWGVKVPTEAGWRMLQ